MLVTSLGKPTAERIELSTFPGRRCCVRRTMRDEATPDGHVTTHPHSRDDGRARMRELERLDALGDEVDPDLDIIARAASAVVETPIGFVSILGEHRLIYRTAQAKRAMPELASTASFCIYTQDAPDSVFVVSDAAQDARFREHPIVVGPPYARAYAGSPLVTSRGVVIGALCVLDTVPRAFSETQRAALRTLARLSVGFLEKDAGDDSALIPPGREAAQGPAAGGRRSPAARVAMFESALVHAADAVLIVAPPARAGRGAPIVYANAAFANLTGLAARDVVGQPVTVLDRATDERDARALAAALGRGQPAIAETTIGRAGHSPVRVEWSVSPIRDEADGSLLDSVIVGRDVTARHALDVYEGERALVLEMVIRNAPLSEQLSRIIVLLRNVITASVGTVMLVEGSRLRCAAADPHMSRNFLAAVEGVEIGPTIGSCGAAIASREPVLTADILADANWAAYSDVTLPSGLRSCWSVPLLSADNRAIGAFALYRPLVGLPTADERRWLEETARFASLVIDRNRDHERLRYLALHDGLTDLPNRRAMEDDVSATIAACARTGQSFALALIDINRFKMVNDAFGRRIGDRLLEAIAARLEAVVDGDRTLGRAGGDEFLVLMRDVANVAEAAAAARRLLGAFDDVYAIDGFELAVRASIGVVLYPSSAERDEDLLAAADRAMFAAKSRGGGIEIAAHMIASTALRALDLDHDLPHTVERNELALHFQTIFDARTGLTAGAEALLRWNHPRFGDLEPGDFIPLAEANGTIFAIGQWALRESVRIAATWQNGRRRFVTVNVSALQFEAPDFVSTVTDALAAAGLDSTLLHLEVTETLIMRNPAACNATMLALKKLGVQIVIDDFGTGYSSLAYLQRFAFDALKIDRAFVREIGVEPPGGRSERVVAAVMNIGRALDVAAIAEGVETPAQLAFVRDCGCAYVQGYYGSRPVADPDWGARIGPSAPLADA